MPLLLDRDKLQNNSISLPIILHSLSWIPSTHTHTATDQPTTTWQRHEQHHHQHHRWCYRIKWKFATRNFWRRRQRRLPFTHIHNWNHRRLCLPLDNAMVATVASATTVTSARDTRERKRDKTKASIDFDRIDNELNEQANAWRTYCVRSTNCNVYITRHTPYTRTPNRRCSDLWIQLKVMKSHIYTLPIHS